MEISNWTPEYFINNEIECRRILQNKWNTVPLANVRHMHDFQDGAILRFNGMIQDMHNPEYYLSKYEVLNKSNNTAVLRNGKYIDSADCKENEIINSDSNNNVTEERSTIVVVSIPGLNDWVLNVQKDPIEPKPSTSNPASFVKRSLEVMDTDTVSETPTCTTTSNKKHCSTEKVTTKENELIISQEYLLNFPIPERPGKVFQVKVYSDSDKLKVNDNVEFVGFVSLNPFLAQTSAADDEEWSGESQMEIQTRNPPPSLIPRLHCISFRPMRHCNPLRIDGPTDHERFKFIRKELHIILTQLLLGDELAAEYLIYYLISEIYLRKDLTALGKFTLNISNIPVALTANYGIDLYDILQSLLPTSHYLAMTLDKLNDSTFIPCKDYDCNRLTSGLLQLSKNTRLIIDETKLTPGKMNESGVRAIGALANIIKQQQLPYDFKFYKMDFEVDIPCLVLSEGKSMLPSDFHIVLRSDDVSVSAFTQTVAAAKVFLNLELISELRVYLTKARINNYELTDTVHTMVENHFLKMRAQTKATGEDLHQLLILARLICLSEGKSTLDEECWNRACQLEADRKDRLKQ